MEMASEKCSWLSLDAGVDPGLHFAPGEICEGSPHTHLHRSKQLLYEPPTAEDKRGVTGTLIDENELTRFETFFHKEAMKYILLSRRLDAEVRGSSVPTVATRRR